MHRAIRRGRAIHAGARSADAILSEARGERVVELLHKFAPTWLAQMPALLSDADRERLQATVQGVNQQRMLREMAQALEALAAETPLVVALEDLHWSDFSTLELISAIARRTEPARLLILALIGRPRCSRGITRCAR